MITAEKQIGSMILQGKSSADFLQFITEKISKDSKVDHHYVVILNLNTQTEQLEIDFKAVSQNTNKDFVWIGNADGSASPQWYFSTNNLKYLISQSLPNFLNLLDNSTPFYQKLNHVFSQLYFDIGPQEGMKNRYRYVWNLEKLKIIDKSMQEVSTTYKGQVDEIIKYLEKSLLEHIKHERGISSKEVCLWNLQVDGIDIVHTEEYVNLVIDEKIGKLFNDEQGVCHLCGDYTQITATTTRFDFKYYITDKMGYSTDLSNNFRNNFSLCKNCYQEKLAGESFIKQNLRFSIGGLQTYLVPNFIFEPKNFDKVFENLLQFKDILLNVSKLNEIESFLRRYVTIKDSANRFVLNLLFFEKNQQEFKVLKLIKDVSPSRIMELVAQNNTTIQQIVPHLGESKMWMIDFNKIYYMIPLKKGTSKSEYRKILTLFDQILTAKPVNREFLIKQFVHLARIHYYKSYFSFNITPPDNKEWALGNSMLQSVVLLKYFENLKLVGGGRGMDTDQLIISSDIKEYIQLLKYDESQTALFLLGYLIGQVGTAQVSKEFGVKSKVILNKLNFQGMSNLKVQRLASEIFEKLKQYKVLKYNEKVYSDMKRLLDANLSSWQLSAQDNIYYILSGYSYQERRLFLNAMKNEGSK